MSSDSFVLSDNSRSDIESGDILEINSEPNASDDSGIIPEQLEDENEYEIAQEEPEVVQKWNENPNSYGPFKDKWEKKHDLQIIAESLITGKVSIAISYPRWRHSEHAESSGIEEKCKRI